MSTCPSSPVAYRRLSHAESRDVRAGAGTLPLELGHWVQRGKTTTLFQKFDTKSPGALSYSEILHLHVMEWSGQRTGHRQRSQ